MDELSLEVNGVLHRVAVHVERRRSTRASIGKGGVVIRLPSSLGAAERREHLERLMRWARRRLEQHPVRSYEDGQELLVAGRRYRLRIAEAGGSRTSVRLGEAEVRVGVARGLAGAERNRTIGARLARAFAREHLPWLVARLDELNRRHFRVAVCRVAMRHTVATWGSCSPSGSLSFSTRLLLAPEPIVEYVCVHELAHRLVPNHSPAFWRLVRRALPDVDERRRWLRRQGRAISW